MRANRARASEQSEAQTMKIGDVAKRSGIGIETLRFYEKSGLISPMSRTVAGYRVYEGAVFDRLAFIRRAQMLGFSLGEIRQIIAESSEGKSPCSNVRGIVRNRLAEVDEWLKEMRSYRRDLAKTLAGWDRIGEQRGHICGLIESAEIKQPPPDNRVARKARAKRRHS